MSDNYNYDKYKKNLGFYKAKDNIENLKLENCLKYTIDFVSEMVSALSAYRKDMDNLERSIQESSLEIEINVLNDRLKTISRLNAGKRMLQSFPRDEEKLGEFLDKLYKSGITTAPYVNDKEMKDIFDL